MKKTALVTGGNRGIGKEVCRQLARMGYQVFLASRDKARGIATVTDLANEGVDTGLIVLDMEDPDSIKNASEELVRTIQKLDVLINNAAILDDMKLITEVPVDTIEKYMNVNLYGPIELTQLLLPLLHKSPDARVINVSSGMGAWAHLDGRFPGYRLSKSALNVATAMFANALLHTTVKVFAMCPGWVKTDMGGEGADRSVQKGAETIIWLATSPEPKTGFFYRDKQIISW